MASEEPAAKAHRCAHPEAASEGGGVHTGPRDMDDELDSLLAMETMWEHMDQMEGEQLSAFAYRAPQSMGGAGPESDTPARQALRACAPAPADVAVAGAGRQVQDAASETSHEVMLGASGHEPAQAATAIASVGDAVSQDLPSDAWLEALLL